MLLGGIELIPFWKLQAIGNDFPLFHEDDVENVNWPELAKQAADRKFGIGGDGILILGKTEHPDEVEMWMFNPDGTEDFCGNGLRVAAWHAFDQKWVGPKFTIHHKGRMVPAEIMPDGLVRTTIGVADYTPVNVPVKAESEVFDTEIGVFAGRTIRGSSLTTGSTHTIVPVAALPSDPEIAALGPEIEYAPQFPDRTSVIFTRTVAPFELDIRIWERGVGETLGCGTGSSAAAADHLRRQGGEGPFTVTVNNPGGPIKISMDAWNTPITIEGTAQTVYEGKFGMR